MRFSTKNSSVTETGDDALRYLYLGSVPFTLKTRAKFIVNLR